MLQLGFSAKRANGANGAAEATQQQVASKSGTSGIINAASATAVEPSAASVRADAETQEVCSPIADATGLDDFQARILDK